jgi:hypothetical protein
VARQARQTEGWRSPPLVLSRGARVQATRPCLLPPEGVSL